jgi:hypothetical protein
VVFLCKPHGDCGLARCRNSHQQDHRRQVLILPPEKIGSKSSAFLILGGSDRCRSNSVRHRDRERSGGC